LVLADEEISTTVTIVAAWTFLTWLIATTVWTVVVSALWAWSTIATVTITAWSAVTVEAASATVSTAISTTSATVSTAIAAASATVSTASATIATKAIAAWAWSAWHILFCFHSLWHWKKSLT
jgi:hypothetical protein